VNKQKLAIALAMGVIGLFTGVETAKADSCSDGTIGSIRFQPCDKIAFVVGGRSFIISTEEFTSKAIARISVAVIQQNVVATELIAKALVEKNHGGFATTILAYKIPESTSNPVPTAIPAQWIASR
jgi:hypothetical protein